MADKVVLDATEAQLLLLYELRKHARKQGATLMRWVLYRVTNVELAHSVT